MCEEEGDKVSTVTYQILSPSGGVADGEQASSPGCSGMSVSTEPCRPGGVEEVFRDRVAEPLRDTQEVSITRTPILDTNTSRVIYNDEERAELGKGKERSGETGHDTVPLYLPNAALVGGREAKGI